jgi:hypothetical protein
LRYPTYAQPHAPEDRRSYPTLRIPQGDLEHRERELRVGAEDAGWTAGGIATNTPPYAA